MSLTADDVIRVAHLARLAVDEREVQAHAAQLARILALVEQMNAVDTAGIEPMAHPRDVALRLRPDEVSAPDRRASLLAVAPATEAGLYLVPKVIE